MALIVTASIEVPIVSKIVRWTVPTLPGNCRKLRDRWIKFHVLCLIDSLTSFVRLVIGAIFYLARNLDPIVLPNASASTCPMFS
jgi:hypothetical protein